MISMFKRSVIQLLIVIMFPSFLYPCLWLEGTTIDGEYKHFNDKTISSFFLKSSEERTPIKNFNSKFYRENNQTLEYKALQEISKAEYKSAIEKLLKIEKTTPNFYATASNLGTAYELSGNTQLAIKWISEGIKRDANSHGGTEWLHLLILKTQLKLKENPSFLNNHHIIPLPNSFSEDTIISIGSNKYTIKKIRQALFYQLRERMIFVKPKNKIVADLLYSFAKIEEQTTVVREAGNLLTMAVRYGFNNENEIGEIRGNLLRADKKFLNYMVFVVLVFLVFILWLNHFLKKRAKSQEKFKKPLGSFNFAFSINTHILFFTILGTIFYGGIIGILGYTLKSKYLFYLLLIPFYLFAMDNAIKFFRKKYIILNISRSIIFTLLIYFIGITLFYFRFYYGISDFYVQFLEFIITHLALGVIIFFFLKLKLKDEAE